MGGCFNPRPVYKPGDTALLQQVVNEQFSSYIPRMADRVAGKPIRTPRTSNKNGDKIRRYEARERTGFETPIRVRASNHEGTIKVDRSEGSILLDTQFGGFCETIEA